MSRSRATPRPPDGSTGSVRSSRHWPSARRAEARRASRSAMPPIEARSSLVDIEVYRRWRRLPRYAQARVYAALLNAAASEHAARQRAMKAATDNADELITALSRVMNRARQDAITTEIMEIAGGAEALQADEGHDDQHERFDFGGVRAALMDAVEAATLRALLVQLSGRQMKWGQDYTAPALLAGLWVLLAMLEALEQHSVEELRRFKQLALGSAEEDSG